jgi:hypothetical protein
VVNYQENKTMEINDAALEYLLARAGLSLTEEQKAELKNVHAAIAAMAQRVRKPRGRMAEPAHAYGFAEEDLA